MVYLKGGAGIQPSIPFHYERLKQKAAKRLSAEAYAYIAGGAGREQTIRANRTGFENWRIVPRMLRDVSRRDIHTDLLGHPRSSPFLLAPIGALALAHRQADLAVARAAARQEVPMIFSNQASVAMEECAAAMGDQPRWFQLYWSKSDELAQSLVQRAEACGCEALVLTLDTTLLGWRVRDLDLAYLPFLRGIGIAQYVSDPVFQRMLDAPPDPDAPRPPRRLSLALLSTLYQMVNNYPGSGFFKKLRSGKPMAAVRLFVNTYSRPSLSWEDLASLRAQTRLPILLKGILHPQDARRAVDEGMDGIIVSNHGGRQVDGAIGAIEALPEVVAAVAGQVPVIMDSGIRSGADAFKAIALGAQAVCLGRPYAFALALGGQAGVETYLQAFQADFELNMALAGCRRLEEIRPECLQRASENK